MFYHENIYNSINSVFFQNYKSWELIIGYDSNNLLVKDTIDKLNKKDYDVTIIEINNIHITKIDILNILKEKSKFNWIAIKDITDCWFYEKLSQQMYIAQGNEYDIIGTNYILDDKFSKRGKIIPSRDINNLDFFIKNPVVNASILIKKELCKWTNKWQFNEEYELFIKLWLKKYKFYNLSNAYIEINIDAYLSYKTPNKNMNEKNMIDYYKTIFQLDGNKSFVLGFPLPSTNHLFG
jgi:hypothetical protein